MFDPSKYKWEKVIKDFLGEEYVSVGSFALGAIHIMVMIHINLMPILSKVESSCIAFGVNNTLGNKGAVSVSFKIGFTSIMCISCHLAAGHDNVEKRNQDFKKVYDKIIMKRDPKAHARSMS